MACDDRRINTAGDDASGPDTECDKCAENYYVDSENCLRCPTGTTNVAGDPVDGGNTECGECAENYYVSANECKECPPGMTNVAGDNKLGGNTTCDATLCSVNQYVSFHVCRSCPDGTTNAAGDDASGDDTECDVTICSANEYVSSHVCKSCPLVRRTLKVMTHRVQTRHARPLHVKLMNMSHSTSVSHVLHVLTNTAGDDASGNNTECDQCAENYYVSSTSANRVLLV